MEATRVIGDHVFDNLSAGFFHACGVAGGEVWCWGAGLYEALGVQGVGATASPIQASLQLPATSIVAGAGLSCASVSGAIHCRGINMTGQLGRGVRSDAEANPAAIMSQTSLSGLSAGGVNSIVSHVCGLAADGRALCWGANDDGQLGSSSSDICQASTLIVACTRTPAAVDTQLAFDAVAAGRDHTCGLANGEVWCWGGNEAGQLGVAGASSTSPVRLEIAS
jgi:alpha-tubulin suppressor-like RCC1 family protein